MAEGRVDMKKGKKAQRHNRQPLKNDPKHWNKYKKQKKENL